MQIQPIHTEQQQQVILEVDRYRQLANHHYQRYFEPIEVVFNLRGRTAGMYKIKVVGGISYRQIRFNPWLFAKYEEDSWGNTIPHEVAHYIADCLYGFSNIKPHGREWQEIMNDFGAEPLVRANYDLRGIPTRKVNRYAYRCACRTVDLSSYRHQKVQRGLQQYICRDCRHSLQLEKHYGQLAE